MNSLFRLMAVVVVGLTLPGCSDDIMNLTPRDQVTHEAIWSDPGLAEGMLFEIYRGVGHGYNGTALYAMEDDGQNIRGGPTARHMLSQISDSDLGDLGGSSRFAHYHWDDLYSSIRETNMFLGEIDSTDFSQDVKDMFKGEAHFLRAYFYHNLLKVFGGVPLITGVYELNDDYEVARASFAEVVDFIVAEADSAAALLPATQSLENLGRATKGAALALKARVLLFAASDLYHENASGMPETGYVDAQDRQAFWRAAKDAARDVMDLGVYDLFRAQPGPGESPGENYADIWLTREHNELIFVRYFLKSRGETDIPNVGRYAGPNGYHNWGSNTPIQNLVDAYRMADGSRFDWANPEHAAAPYENRDPRFYASIQYDGARWVERPSDVVHLDPVGIIQTFSQLELPDGTIVPGLDTRNGPIEAWNGTYSGYYLRKFIDPTVNHQFEAQDVPWVFFRYAEILLNYAEASIELNELDDARTALNRIRRRAGIPEFDGSLGQAELREEYQNERRVELAFEEHRYFDARRWMIAPRFFGENAKGIDIRVKATDSSDRSTYRDYRYQVIDIQERAWDDKMYFMPIHRDELNRNSMLVQNPGY